MLDRLLVDSLTLSRILYIRSLYVEASTEISHHYHVFWLYSQRLLQTFDSLVGIVLADIVHTLVSQSHEVVRILSDSAIKQFELLFLHLQRRVHAVKTIKNHVVVLVVNIEVLQLLDVSQRVSLILQTILHNIELQIECFLSLLRILHSHVAVLLATLDILSLISITCSKECHLS